ncbi:TIGR03619 family F420-dependent LLM class oxidoreductase [Kineosporia sp. J2-2]|uniref:TIGR03619 family F420-dependent LLM class oxidoreductase n=1 Tax=Kineosporia corallincola TaxID=2835133 RepID=A0ABS5TKH7_9ACTN|nr:TIGR03619 family F420-dependent LLM class oxidoreductase [Kineosporia corallincola]MBT0771601.1 TIGR03619 family F420-dependent LLM class oxidoreductase [Kineosporia corallincola]
MIKLGVSLPQLPWYHLNSDIVTAAQGFEQIGLDSAWAFERFLVPDDQSGPHGLYQAPDVPWPDYYRDCPDALTVLATAGAVTSRLELGTNVLVAPLHVPARLAKTVASVDRISGGRVIAGLGTGWSIDEYQAAAPRPFAERGAALDEFLDVARAVWGPDPVEFGNERYRIAPGNVGPKPARRIPVLLAGGQGRAFDRIARRADGWLPVAHLVPDLGGTLKQLRDRATGYGRRGDLLSCTVQVTVNSFEPVAAQGRRPYQGSPEQLADDVAALAEAGVDHVFLACTAACRSVGELVDRAAQFHAAVRAAGL